MTKQAQAQSPSDKNIVRVNYEIAAPAHMARVGSVRVIAQGSDAQTLSWVHTYLQQAGFKWNTPGYEATMSIEATPPA